MSYIQGGCPPFKNPHHIQLAEITYEYFWNPGNRKKKSSASRWKGNEQSPFLHNVSFLRLQTGINSKPLKEFFWKARTTSLQHYYCDVMKLKKISSKFPFWVFQQVTTSHLKTSQPQIFVFARYQSILQRTRLSLACCFQSLWHS